MSQQQYQPHVTRTTATIRNDDEGVRVVGKVTEFVEQTAERWIFTLVDRFGSINVHAPPDRANWEIDQLVRVLGRVALDTSGASHLEAEFVQDMTGLDLDLYHETLELVAK